MPTIGIQPGRSSGVIDTSGPTLIELLERLEKLGVLVAALPSSPANGEIVYFQNEAMREAGVIWGLRFRAKSASAHKWEFVGGADLRARQSVEPSAPEQKPAAGFGYKAINNTPKLTIPLEGDYDIWISGSALNQPAATTTDVRIAPAEGSTLLTNDINYPGIAEALASESAWANVGGPVRTTGIPLGTEVGIAFAGSNEAAKLRFYAMTISVRPVRVG